MSLLAPKIHLNTTVFKPSANPRQSLSNQSKLPSNKYIHPIHAKCTCICLTESELFNHAVSCIIESLDQKPEDGSLFDFKQRPSKSHLFFFNIKA